MYADMSMDNYMSMEKSMIKDTYLFINMDYYLDR